ncbi:MAG TPA: VOC family protein [Puia sp.]|jgi:methylmalonyl-CoA/ethylmalonyl-CoA epimerase|nr:VOC family protein [Puia sp.]
MQLHHIGVACRDIEEEIGNICRVHEVLERTPIVYDPCQEATVAMLTLADGTRIELVAGAPVQTLLRKGIGYYHLCFEVGDIESEIARLVLQNALLLSPPKPSVLFGGRKVAFLQASYGLVELLSANKD